jgi:hypothetical protein
MNNDGRTGTMSWGTENLMRVFAHWHSPQEKLASRTHFKVETSRPPWPPMAPWLEEYVNSSGYLSSSKIRESKRARIDTSPTEQSNIVDDERAADDGVLRKIRMYKIKAGCDSFSTRKSVLAASVQAKAGNASAKQESTSSQGQRK